MHRKIDKQWITESGRILLICYSILRLQGFVSMVTINWYEKVGGDQQIEYIIILASPQPSKLFITPVTVEVVRCVLSDIS